MYWECVLCIFNDRCVLFLWLEFIIQYEENHWEPEKWKELLRVAGSQFSAPLTLYGHINYQFRVIAFNAIGRSRPSMPSERYKTPPCGRDTCDPWRLAFVMCYHPQCFGCPWFTLDLFEACLCGDLPWENYTDVYKSSINVNAVLSERCLRLSMTACSSLCVIHIGSVRGQWYYWLRQMLNNSYSHLYSSWQEPRKH